MLPGLVGTGFFGAGSGSWTPTTLGSTLRGWYVADTETEADGAALVTLHDRSGNGYDATESATVQTLKHGILNGKKVVRSAADAVGGRTVLSTAGLMNGATAGTYLAVFKCSADPGTSRQAGILGNFGTGTAANSHIVYSDSNLYDGFGTDTRVSFNPTPSMSADFRIYGARAVSGDWTAWIDGTQEFNRASNTVAFGSGDRWFFWNDNGVDDFAFVGDIAEIIICDSGLSTSDRQKAEGYLANKYALTGNLPSGHPYKSSPP